MLCFTWVLDAYYLCFEWIHVYTPFFMFYVCIHEYVAFSFCLPHTCMFYACNAFMCILQMICIWFCEYFVNFTILMCYVHSKWFKKSNMYASWRVCIWFYLLEWIYILNVYFVCHVLDVLGAFIWILDMCFIHASKCIFHVFLHAWMCFLMSSCLSMYSLNILYLFTYSCICCQVNALFGFSTRDRIIRVLLPCEYSLGKIQIGTAIRYFL